MIEDEVKFHQYLIDFSGLLLIVIGVIGLGFAYFFGKMMINLDPPTTKREELAFAISFICLILSLLSIVVGILLELFKRKGLLLGPLGLFLFLLGGINVATHIIRKYAWYSRLGFGVSQMDLRTTLAEVLVWLIVMYLGIFLLVVFIFGSGTIYVWKKIQRESL